MRRRPSLAALAVGWLTAGIMRQIADGVNRRPSLRLALLTALPAGITIAPLCLL